MIGFELETYISQYDVPHNDKYAGSDGKSPDGCWMNASDGSGALGFGPGSRGCTGNTTCGGGEGKSFCIRHDAGGVTALFMALKHLGLDKKPTKGPKEEDLNDWLKNNDFSPTWIYHWIMDFYGSGKNVGASPHFKNGDWVNNPATWMALVARVLKDNPGGKVLGAVTPRAASAGTGEASAWGTYKQLIQSGSPVLMSATDGSVMLGTGYDEPDKMAVQHPAGRGRQGTNECGAKDAKGALGKNLLVPWTVCTRMLLGFQMMAEAREAGVAREMAGGARGNPLLGADFSSVRVREGAPASTAGARAFTGGSSIAFAPGAAQQLDLLGQELAHVVQQRGK